MTARTEIRTSSNVAHPDQIVRLIRRICLLRELGQSAGAARLEATELATALDHAREAEGAEGLTLDALERLYAVEADRAANAAVLAELIVTRLNENFTVRSPSSPAPTPAAAGATPAFSPARPIPGGAPAIPDLLDAMLAHDRSAARRPATSRQAGSGSTDQ